MKKIAITGGIGSGKTTVARMLTPLFTVLNCDSINADLLENDLCIRHQITDAFGEEIYTDRKCNKNLLADVIFSDVEKKRILEAIMHPRILQRIDTYIADSIEDIVFVEVPLLFEVEWQQYFDFSVLVISDYNTTMKRLLLRGMEEEEVKKRLLNQMDPEEKIILADYVIENNGTMEELHEKVLKLVEVVRGL